MAAQRVAHPFRASVSRAPSTASSHTRALPFVVTEDEAPPVRRSPSPHIDDDADDDNQDPITTAKSPMEYFSAIPLTPVLSDRFSEPPSLSGKKRKASSQHHTASPSPRARKQRVTQSSSSETPIGFDVSEARSVSSEAETIEQFQIPDMQIRGEQRAVPFAPRGEDDDDGEDGDHNRAPARAIIRAGQGGDYRIAPSLLPHSYTQITDGSCAICAHESAGNMIPVISLEIIRRVLQFRVFSECCKSAFEAWNAYVDRAPRVVVVKYKLVKITNREGFRHAYVCPSEEIIILARLEELMSAMLTERIQTSALYRLNSGSTVFAPESSQILNWQTRLAMLRVRKEEEAKKWREKFQTIVAGMRHA
jgi:hypothetical protein